MDPVHALKSPELNPALSRSALENSKLRFTLFCLPSNIPSLISRCLSHAPSELTKRMAKGYLLGWRFLSKAHHLLPSSQPEIKTNRLWALPHLFCFLMLLQFMLLLLLYNCTTWLKQITDSMIVNSEVI